MNEVINPTISLTENAVKELRSIREKDNISGDKVLRVGAKGGGCSGLSYVLEFDEKKEFDDEYEISGIRVVVDKRHALYVAGMIVDYQHGLNDRGFIFQNPNAKESCGCGTSFAV